MTGKGEPAGTDFWSRRKAAVRQSEVLERQQDEADLAASKRTALESLPDEEILEQLQLPDPDSLTESSDFKQFLSAAVPDRLRRRALRRLWGLNPVLANLDGLVDYAEDYTDAATVVSGMQTVYQVGKGMIDRLAEALEKVDAENGDAGSSSSTVSVEEFAAPQEEKNVALHNGEGEDEVELMQLTQGDVLLQDDDLRDSCGSSIESSVLEEEDLPPRRRRMRFDYS